MENYSTLQSYGKLQRLPSMLMCLYRSEYRCSYSMLIGCLHFEQIRKANVDHFSLGGMIPKCELLLRWPHRDKSHVCLEHDIELTGAKDCCSYFTLYIPDAGEKSSLILLQEFYMHIMCESFCIEYVVSSCRYTHS